MRVLVGETVRLPLSTGTVEIPLDEARALYAALRVFACVRLDDRFVAAVIDDARAEVRASLPAWAREQ